MLDLRNNFNLYSDFYMVAKEKSMSEVSKKYFISTSTLSKNINTLESLLNVKLINSSNSGTTLTLDGERLFEKLDILFRTIDTLEDVPKNIIIGTTRNIADNFLSKYIILFNKKFPDIHISLKIDNPLTLTSLFNAHKIDFMIDYLPFNSNNANYNVEIKTIASFNTCFACSKEFYNANVDNLKDINNILKQQLLIPGQSRRRQFLNNYLQDNNLEVKPIIELPDSKLMIDLVKSGLGIGYFINKEIEDEDLVILDVEGLPQNPFGVIYSKEYLNSISKDFIDILLNK